MGQLKFRADDGLESRIDNYADDNHGGNRSAAMKRLIDRALIQNGYGRVVASQTTVAKTASMMAQAMTWTALGLVVLMFMTPFDVLFGVLGFTGCAAAFQLIEQREPAISEWWTQWRRSEAVATDGGQ